MATFTLNFVNQQESADSAQSAERKFNKET